VWLAANGTNQSANPPAWTSKSGSPFPRSEYSITQSATDTVWIVSEIDPTPHLSNHASMASRL